MTPGRNAPVDVLVVGAGPAGLTSAIAAAERGKRVLVLDLGLRAGGQIWRHRDPAALPRIARQCLERARVAGVTVAAGARVVDVLSPTELVVDFRGRVDRQLGQALILATGARERMVPFPGWTLPGVVGIGGLQALLKGGLNLEGSRVVIAGTGPLLFPVAAAVASSGADLRLVAEQASIANLARFALALAAKPVAIRHAIGFRWAMGRAPFRSGTWVVSADGDDRLRRVHLSSGGSSVSIECDWLATGAGLSPNVELAQLLGCATGDGGIRVDATQRTSVPGIWAAGECTGIKGDQAAMAEGEIAGAAAAGDEPGSRRRSLQRRRRSGIRLGDCIAREFMLRAELKTLAAPDTVICRCEDVRRSDIDPRWTQRQAKLWTRIGMGECQGAICGPACAAMYGWRPNLPRAPLGAPALGEWLDCLARPATRREQGSANK